MCRHSSVFAGILRAVLLVLAFAGFVSCGGGGGADKGNAPADGALVITGQPVNQSVTVGQTATFTVTATGSGPLGYQWRKGEVPISSARSASYTTPVTVLADSGSQFSVLITDASGASISGDQVSLTVTEGGLTQHYVDPVNGSDQGDGSSGSPWKTLQDVIDHKVETRTWEGPLRYTAGQKLVPVNAGAPVKAGDTIWLRSGYYGALSIQSAYNLAPVSVAAEVGGSPRFSEVLVRSSQNWILRGFSVSPSYAATYSTGTMVTVENHSWQGPAYDIVIDEFEIFSVPNETVWTLASDWDTKAANAVIASGDRVTVRNCQIRNTNFGISMTGLGSRVEGNTIDGFSGDGMRGLGDDEVFEYNLVKNRRDVNANHPDGFQSWSLGSGGVGTGVVKNITLRGNTIIAYEDPAIPFVGTLQGIGCFDGFYEGWIVENNVVITDHWHGISLYGARNCRIVNNTVLDLNSVDPGPPWIMVTAHKNGTLSQNCIVRNNLTTDLSVVGENMTEDHNILLPVDPAPYFVDLAHHNVHLSPDSPALDQGSSTLAPAIDADMNPRPNGTAIDVGAYERMP